MAAVSVPSTGPVPLNVPPPGALIQNLGSVDVYVDADSAVSSTSGFKLGTLKILAVPGGYSYYARAASSTADVRVIPGHGVFA